VFPTVLGADVLQDDLAVSPARVMAAANRRAREAGVDVACSLVTISQQAGEGGQWRINYGPRDYVNRRGGDVVIDVEASSATVTQLQRGQ
jgi:hypothetical protein